MIEVVLLYFLSHEFIALLKNEILYFIFKYYNKVDKSPLCEIIRENISAQLFHCDWQWNVHFFYWIMTKLLENKIALSLDYFYFFFFIFIFQYLSNASKNIPFFIIWSNKNCYGSDNSDFFLSTKKLQTFFSTGNILE